MLGKGGTRDPGREVSSSSPGKGGRCMRGWGFGFFYIEPGGKHSTLDCDNLEPLCWEGGRYCRTHPAVVWSAVSAWAPPLPLSPSLCWLALGTPGPAWGGAQSPGPNAEGPQPCAAVTEESRVQMLPSAWKLPWVKMSSWAAFPGAENWAPRARLGLLGTSCPALWVSSG